MNSRSLPVLILVAIGATCSAVRAPAAIDMFAKLDGLEGESTDAAHHGWIDLVSFSHGMSAPAGSMTGGGRTAGKATADELTVTKAIDKTTPMLNRACCRGEHFRRLTLECAQPSDHRVFLVLTFEDVLVTAVSASGTASAPESRPMETVKFAFSRITWEYRPEGGPAVKSVWDGALSKSW